MADRSKVWFKIEADYWRHPRWQRVSFGNGRAAQIRLLAAEGLWVRMLAYCAEFLTDGVVPHRVLAELDPSGRIIKGLADAGVILESIHSPVDNSAEPVDNSDRLDNDGITFQTNGITFENSTQRSTTVWVIPNYLDHQRSRASVEQERKANAERQARFRAGHKGDRPDSPFPRNAVTSGVTEDPDGGPRNGVTNAPVTPLRVRERTNYKQPTTTTKNQEKVLGGTYSKVDARERVDPPKNNFQIDKNRPRCEQHAAWEPGRHVPPCRLCADAKRWADAELQLERFAEERAKRKLIAAIAACTQCDESGLIELPSGGVRKHHLLSDFTESDTLSENDAEA